MAPEADLAPPPPPPPEAVPEAEALPLPPPPAPSPPAQAAPAQPAPEAPRMRPRAAPSPFPGTLDLSRGPRISAAPPMPSAPPRQRRAPGQLDLSMNRIPDARPPRAPRPGSGAGMVEHVSGAQPGEDWNRAFRAWGQARIFFPQQAADAGEDGTVRLELDVAKDGKVLAVRMKDRSGSRWLDMAGVSMFRNQTLPPFPLGTVGDTTTIRVSLHYTLIMQ
jgi:TonB family protein